MTKELEALEKLRQNNKDGAHLFDNELLDIIETALKENDRLKKENLVLLVKEKALEIIKETQVNIFTVMHSKNYEDFRKKCFDVNCLYLRFPTQKEYDLLKEVLL